MLIQPPCFFTFTRQGGGPITTKEMATIRREKRQTPFVQIDKAALQDKSLSWKAKGLLAYLLSLPDDWQVYQSEICNHATDGKDSTKTAFEELIAAGYISREKAPKVQGKFTGYNYTVAEKPLRMNRCGKPVNGKPATTNNDNTNNDLTNIREDDLKKSPNPPTKKRTRFTPPSLEAVTEQFKEKLRQKKVLGFEQIAGAEAEKFYNHYEANGWKVGKNKMKSWPAAVGGWISRMNQYQTHVNTSKKLGYGESIINQDDAHAIIDDVIANGW